MIEEVIAVKIADICSRRVSAYNWIQGPIDSIVAGRVDERRFGPGILQYFPAESSLFDWTNGCVLLVFTS